MIITRTTDLSMTSQRKKKGTSRAELFLANDRLHAGFFSFKSDRCIEEWGVLREFEDSLAREDEAFFFLPRHRGPNNDPPDCEAVDGRGSRIGIEVTEFVDSASVAAAHKRQRYDWKDWRLDLIPRLRERIREKDNPSDPKDPPYSEYVLLVYTDEPRLGFVRAREILAHHLFPATPLITRAYLLFSYVR